MRIVLLHYHLVRGGVNSVLLQQARSLKESGHEVLILAGNAAQGMSDEELSRFGDIPIGLIHELGYDHWRAWKGNAEERQKMAIALTNTIQAEIKKRWSSGADILHVHNPLIRKNSLLLPALRMLQDEGQRLFLQNHDFAEDFRPDVYFPDEAYPENCHYACINGRDFSFLKRSGLQAEGLHFLPNTVVPLSATKGLERTRFVYPVRSIRRKNIGEALLLSLFLPKDSTVAITLPPSPGKEEPSDVHWRSVAARLQLPMEFDVGLKESLPDVMGSARAVLTSSVKEGFGFSFLEPWTAHRMVVGRRIDWVCRDFEHEGMVFSNMYNQLKIPKVYLPIHILRRKMEQALTSIYSAFNITMQQYNLDILSEDIVNGEWFDYGRLDEELQSDVIELICSNAKARQDILDMNPFLSRLMNFDEDEFEQEIEANHDVVLQAWSRERGLERLESCYTQVLEHDVQHKLSRNAMMELYLDPLQMSLVGLGNING